MNSEFKLAMQLTMIDMLSGVAQTARRNIVNMGEAGKEVARDFDLMQAHITRGLKSIAIARYGLSRIKPGVEDAADLQGAMLDVQMSLMRSGQNAATLGEELAGVRSTATDLQKIAPFSAQDVVEIQRELLSAGLEYNSVIGKGGAAWAATALATITKEDPRLIGKALVTIGAPFNLQGNQYGQLADWMQRAGMSGVAKVPDIMEAMKYVSQTAHSFKISWQDTIAAISTLGEQGQIGSIGGTNLNDFLVRLTGASRITRRVIGAVNRDLVGRGRDPLEFWDKQGKLKSMPALIANLRTSMEGFDDHKKMFILEKIFGQQGMRAALALMKEGIGSWEATNKKMREAADLETKMNVRLQGFSANVTSLQGTAKTALANMFDPALNTLTAMTQEMNNLVQAVGNFSGKHRGLTAGLDATLGLGVAGLGAYGIYNLVKGAGYGKRVLSSLGVRGMFGSLGGTAMGIAEGKAVQAATGVPSVFVTNWPAGMSGPGAVAADAVAASTVRRMLPWAAIAGWGTTAAVGAGIPLSMAISSASRENGWSSQTFSRGSREYEVMGIGGRRGATKNEINLAVTVDGQGRVVSRSNDMNTSIKTVPRGDFFAGAKRN